MLRRSVALALWAYFGWYLGVFIAHAAGVSWWIGPAAAVITAIVAVVDWPRLRRARRHARTEGFQLGS